MKHENKHKIRSNALCPYLLINVGHQNTYICKSKNLHHSLEMLRFYLFFTAHTLTNVRYFECILLLPPFNIILVITSFLFYLLCLDLLLVRPAWEQMRGFRRSLTLWKLRSNSRWYSFWS